MKKIAFISFVTILILLSWKKDETATPAQNMGSQIKAYPIEPLNSDQPES